MAIFQLGRKIAHHFRLPTNHGCASYNIHDAVSYLGSLERSAFRSHGRQAIQRDIMKVLAGDSRGGAHCLVEASTW